MRCLLPLLIEEAVSSVFGVKLNRPSAEVFTHSGLFGIKFAGDFPNAEELLVTEEGWNYFWLEMPIETHQKLFSGLEEGEEAFVRRRNRLKEKLREDSHAFRRRGYVAGLFFDMQELYIGAMTRLGLSAADIERLSLDDRVRLVTEVPPLDVEVALAIQHQQQWDRVEVENDARDIRHLCLAIPYCDVVLTERYWVDKAKREKLDSKYGTEMYSDLAMLCKL